MDDIRDTRPWFWILFLLVFAIAVAGLVIAISAQDSSVDESKVVKEATAEVREELDGLNGAIEAADEFQEESDKQAARDRRQIRNAVAEAEAGANQRLRKLTGRVAELEVETTELEREDTATANRVKKLVEGQETLEAEVTRINQRLRTITAEGV